MIRKKVVLKKGEKEVLKKELSNDEKIHKESALSWDGSNLLVRIPNDIANYLGLTEKNRFEKNLKFIIEEKEGKIQKLFEITDRNKPKRKTKKK